MLQNHITKHLLESKEEFIVLKEFQNSSLELGSETVEVRDVAIATQIVLKNNQEEDVSFLQEFCKTQIFSFYLDNNFSIEDD